MILGGLSKANVIYTQSTYTNGNIGEIQDLILSKACHSKNLLGSFNCETNIMLYRFKFLMKEIT